MKKLLGILVLGLLWCGTANAGLNEPGSKKNFKCTEAGQTGYKEAIAYLKKKPKKNAVVYAACSGSLFTYAWQAGSNLEKLHKKAYKRCTKRAEGYDMECFLFLLAHTYITILAQCFLIYEDGYLAFYLRGGGLKKALRNT